MHQIWLSTRFVATSPEPSALPRLQKSTPQPWVSVHNWKVLWSKFSEEKPRPQRGEIAVPVQAPLFSAPCSLDSSPKCPLWAQSVMTLGSDLESPATSNPMDLFSIDRCCAWHKGCGLCAVRFPSDPLGLEVSWFSPAQVLTLPFSRCPLPFPAVNYTGCVYFANLGWMLFDLLAHSICSRIRLKICLSILLPLSEVFP